MDKTHTISVGKTGSGLLVVFQEKIESNIEKESNARSEILDPPQDFIGKFEGETIIALKAHNISFRVSDRDGAQQELTTDHWRFRWNLSINDGIITNIRIF
jgi:hypothetical protein